MTTQTLLAALAESDDVKGTIAQRLRRRDLQTSYGQALLWAKGFAAEETMAAFARVGEFVVSDKDAAARIAVYDARCLRSFMRGGHIAQARPKTSRIDRSIPIVVETERVSKPLWKKTARLE